MRKLLEFIKDHWFEALLITLGAFYVIAAVLLVVKYHVVSMKDVPMWVWVLLK